MKTRRVPRLLLLIGLIGLAAFLVGGGNDCPKPCTIEGAACAKVCGEDPNHTCSATLECGGGGDPDAPSEPAEPEAPQE
jgi:hypothetical protein